MKKFINNAWVTIVIWQLLFISGLWIGSAKVDSATTAIPAVFWFGTFCLWAFGMNKGWFKNKDE